MKLLFGVLWFLLLLFTRRRPRGISPRKTPGGMVVTGTPEGGEVISAEFDVQTEIAKLAERIMEPVAAKLTMQELEHAVTRIRQAFEHLNTKRTSADTNFEDMAVNIMKPVQPVLNEAEFTRVVDRLRGAMVGFCQTDWGQSVA